MHENVNIKTIPIIPHVLGIDKTFSLNWAAVRRMRRIVPLVGFHWNGLDEHVLNRCIGGFSYHEILL